MLKYKVRHAGLSYDKRTNRWELTCPDCGKVFEPPTTMLAMVTEECPKCNFIGAINYNAYLDKDGLPV